MSAYRISAIIMIVFLSFSCKQETKNLSVEQFLGTVKPIVEAGDSATALRMLEQYGVDHPDSIVPQILAVSLRYEMGRIDEDLRAELIQKLMLRDTSSYWSKQFRSAQYLETASPEEALVELQKQIKQDPKNAWNYLEKGRRLIKLERYDEAITAFDIAIELEPQNRYSYADRALAQYLKGDKEGACEAWQTPGGGSIDYREKYCK
ncbi:MAG: hypothetical protein QM762_09155 [Chryseolinea sp.]